MFFLFEHTKNVWTLVKEMSCAAHTDMYCQQARFDLLYDLMKGEKITA
jgi:hypothetical protein